MYPDDEVNSLVSQVIEANKDLAYDGSNQPPKRDLTARERDILVRLINNIFNHKRLNPPVWNDDPPFPGWNMSPVPIVIGEGDFFNILWEIREAIDPREEE